MTRRRRWLGIAGAVVIAAGLSGCVSTPTNDGDPVKVHEEARADLARWDAAIAAAGGQSGVVPVGEMTTMVGDWGSADGGNNKLAWGAGLFVADVAVPIDTPPDGEVRWQDGSRATVPLISAEKALSQMKAEGISPCPECVPLHVTGVQLTTASIQTTRGPAQAPVWEFSLEGTPATFTHVAIAARLVIPTPSWNPEDPPVGNSIQSATGTVGGLTLTVTIFGVPGPASEMCGADYTAEAVESATAVVVIVTTHPNTSLFQSCSAVGAYRTAEARLAAPLGDRSVLEVTQGLPVPVTLTP